AVTSPQMASSPPKTCLKWTAKSGAGRLTEKVQRNEVRTYRRKGCSGPKNRAAPRSRSRHPNWAPGETDGVAGGRSPVPEPAAGGDAGRGISGMREALMKEKSPARAARPKRAV